MFLLQTLYIVSPNICTHSHHIHYTYLIFVESQTGQTGDKASLCEWRNHQWILKCMRSKMLKSGLDRKCWQYPLVSLGQVVTLLYVLFTWNWTAIYPNTTALYMSTSMLIVVAVIHFVCMWVCVRVCGNESFCSEGACLMEKTVTC